MYALRRFCVAGVGPCALPRGWTPWRPLGLRLFCGTMCVAKGRMSWQAWDTLNFSDVRPGVLGAPPLLRGRRGQCALPRGRMYALASLGAPPLLCGRRGTMCTAKGSDVRPRVPWVSASFAWQAWHNVHCQGVGCTPSRPLGLRLFCVAGMAQCALPRARMYALAFLGSPPLLRGGTGLPLGWDGESGLGSLRKMLTDTRLVLS